VIDFLYGGERVMTQTHAASIVTTVLRELVDNVFDHAHYDERGALQQPHALIGGLVVHQAHTIAAWSAKELYRVDQPYNDWLLHRDTPIVRLIVCDSGVGIPATLKPGRQRNSSHAPRSSELILSSFGPSTSRYHTSKPPASSAEAKRRGLGLASVERFARGYRGRVAVRSANAQAGLWCPLITAEPFHDDALAYIPGTCLEVSLGLTLAARSAAYSATQSPLSAARDDVLFAVVRSSRPDDLVRAALAAANATTVPHPIVALFKSHWPSARHDRTAVALAIREAARRLAGLAGLAVVIPQATLVDIKTTFSPLDDLGESRPTGGDSHLAAPEWSPPALVLAADGSPTWIGGSETIRGVFYTLLEGGERVALDPVLRRIQPRSPERDYLLAESDWLLLDHSRTLFLRVDPPAIDAAVSADTQSALAKHLSFTSQQQ
jgi:hypothetical protein